MEQKYAKFTYPFVSMNHLAMMKVMQHNRLFFPKQVEALLGMRVHVIPPGQCPDGETPLAVVVKGKGEAKPLDLARYMGGI